MTADPLIGARIGSYVVERKLGEGGMGAVYELVHPGIGKRLALKTLHASLSAQEQIVQRFFDEARAVNLIGHPNIVDIIDFSRLEDGRSYLTMEYLEGESLADRLRRGPLAPEGAAQIAAQICSALAAAHEAGITHRDLKPENIHLSPRPGGPPYVKVLDFGIAKLGDHLDPTHRTESGIILGTPAYMSPEQAMGRTQEIDYRTDVYALGVILYEMLSGRPPFEADSFPAYILKHSQDPPPPLAKAAPGIPPIWDRVVQRALAKGRDRRFQSMEEMAAAIEAAAASGPPARRRPRWIPIALAGTLAAATAAALFLVRSGAGEAKSPAPDAGGEIAGAAVAADVAVAAAGPPDAATEGAHDPGAHDPAPPVARVRPDARPPRQEDPRPRGRGKLRVTAAPWGEVFVDGMRRGVTPITLTLPAGRHRVTVVNDELGERRSRRVRVRRGKQRILRVTFED